MPPTRVIALWDWTILNYIRVMMQRQRDADELREAEALKDCEGPESADLKDFMHQEGRLLFEVVHARVAIRAKPSVNAQILDARTKGMVVQCVEMSDAWVRLSPENFTSGERYEESWMLTDGNHMSRKSEEKRLV
eukprot:gnl/MRDRNA2_/MRDRNA2_21251_c0_seq1.p1 gnl/MRDRNA2_/MRDRNA2_21251_c0~~gnl/MRDRNA2_/MRDRNA2_21251_c0_seq1.p1  ORF type:complete len:143 (+),score=26.02 gnl/MRDRNA2_/MRDRNA2_21251_c0_seq1:26-430(+)